MNRVGVSQRGLRWALALVGAAAALAMSAAPASAVLFRLPNGKTVSYMPVRQATPQNAQPRPRNVQPFDSAFSNLDYNGGPVMPSNSDYVIYWSPSGIGAYPSDYKSGLDQYFTDLAHDSGGHQNVDSVSTQYNDLNGHLAAYNVTFVVSGHDWIDTHPYPTTGACSAAPSCVTDAQLQTELQSFISANSLPEGMTTEYFVMFPPNVATCFDSGPNPQCSTNTYCAYHSNIGSGSTAIIYANDPYMVGDSGCDDGNHPNGSTSDGALEAGLTHEHNESITDPLPNSAWADFGQGSNGDEIGDKCDTQMGTSLGTTVPGGAKYNQVINGHFYWYQEEWSNQGHTCLQRFTLSGTAPVASFTQSPGSGGAITFDASASTAPGGVSQYVWQFNEAGGGSPQVTTIETSFPTISHTFPAAGTYQVALTVMASDGTSNGTAHDVTASSGGGGSGPSQPSNNFPPLVLGNAQQGQTLSESPGSWTPTPDSLSYQWVRCDSTGNNCSAIPGAVQQQYTLTASDVGHTIEVQESATVGGGPPGTATSGPTNVIASLPQPLPSSTSRPTISGQAQEGQTLIEGHGSWNNNPTVFAYQWQSCRSTGSRCNNIPGATNQTYVPGASDVGRAIVVVETAYNGAGGASAASRATSLVTAVGPGVVSLGASHVVGQAATLRVSCAKSRCTVKLQLTTTQTVKQGRKKRTIMVAVGSATVTLGAGRSQVAKVSLNATGKRLLAQKHRLRVKLSIKRAGKTIATRQLTFKRKPKPKHDIAQLLAM